MIDKSAPLMGWAVNMMGQYLLQNWDSGMNKGDLVETAKREYRRIKTEAADIGTLVHEYAENWIKGKKPKMPEDEHARNGIMAFLSWVKQIEIKFDNSERIIYSRKYDYTGIMDWDGVDNGDPIIGDFKTSKGIYSEMRYQLAGYWNAMEEEMGMKYLRGYIVQFGKETGDFAVKEIKRSEYLKDRKAFLAALAIKKREQELK